MASIFSLFGEVFIDNTNANKSIDQTTEKAEKSGSKVGSAFSSIAKGAVAVGTAVVTGAAAVGGAAYKMAKETAGAADNVDKMSQKIGISREAYQEWDYVMSQNGMSIDKLQTGIKTLTSQMDSAKKGASSSAEAFDRLGISVTNSDGSLRSQEDVFEETIKALQSVDNETERARLATQLFGKAGVEMAPLLNQSAESTEALKNKARELGMVMSDETIDSGVKFTDTIDTIKRGLGGLFNNLGGTILPLVQMFLSLIIDKLPAIQELFGRLSPIIQRLFNNILPPLFDLVETLLPILMKLLESAILPVFEKVIVAILPAIISLIQQVLPMVTRIIEVILPVLLTLLDEIMPFLKPILDILTSLLSPLTDLLNIILPPIISLLTSLINKVLPPLQSAFSGVANVISTVFKGAFEGIGKYITNIKNVFSGIIDFVKNVFTGNWRGAWNAVVKIFSNIFEGIKNAFKVPINWIIDGINVFIRGLNKLKIPDWVPGIGGYGLNIKELSRLRIGLEYVPYDEFPALLHKGERVLTEGENKEYNKAISAEKTEKEGKTIVNITLGERAIYIERLDGESEEDMDGFIDRLLELIAEKIKRKGLVFG